MRGALVYSVGGDLGGVRDPRALGTEYGESVWLSYLRDCTSSTSKFFNNSLPYLPLSLPSSLPLCSLRF